MRGTCSHQPSFDVAGVALGRIQLRFVWQVWHLLHLAALSPLVARDAAVSVALGDMHLRFTWQARGTWRHRPAFGVASVALVALGWLWWRAWSPLVARDAAALCMAGVGGTWRDPPSFHVARHLGTSIFVFASQARHFWQWVGSGGVLGRR